MKSKEYEKSAAATRKCVVKFGYCRLRTINHYYRSALPYSPPTGRVHPGGALEDDAGHSSVAFSAWMAALKFDMRGLSVELRQSLSYSGSKLCFHQTWAKISAIFKLGRKPLKFHENQIHEGSNPTPQESDVAAFKTTPETLPHTRNKSKFNTG